ncbi:hypothetical protein NCER_100151 [Vairimorpha ceranae BRL01]|uniref:Uncharacterized protein n=2 Tax=Vairimorpha ceranae TaxID=40302 RepID=C4V6V4_VAIC1|nr:hypothetical protein NCER_100151 [Vairimorpha ceranae BRL01]KAF5140237.1 hypothetical protein G9O61_00g016240 [Vairimorpha ceranae]
MASKENSSDSKEKSKKSMSSELKESTSTAANIGSATFSSTTYDTTDYTNDPTFTDPSVITLPIEEEMPSIDRPSTMEFDPQILEPTTTAYEENVILDRNANPVRELGFQEKIALPNDFSPNDVKLQVETDGFTVFCDKEQPSDSKVQTSSYHQMKYSRMFDRPIREVYMEVIEGKILVVGEFADYDYPQ